MYKNEIFLHQVLDITSTADLGCLLLWAAQIPSIMLLGSTLRHAAEVPQDRELKFPPQLMEI